MFAQISLVADFLQRKALYIFLFFPLKEGVEEVRLEVAEVAIQGEAAGVAGEAVWVATVTWVAQWEVGEAAQEVAPHPIATRAVSQAVLTLGIPPGTPVQGPRVREWAAAQRQQRPEVQAAPAAVAAVGVDLGAAASRTLLTMPETGATTSRPQTIGTMRSTQDHLPTPKYLHHQVNYYSLMPND